jgi:P-type E1-E2 ATPase
MINFLKKYSLATYIAFLVIIVGLIGLILYTQGHSAATNILFFYSAIILACPLWFEILKSMKEGEFGVDLIAGIAILTSIIFGQPLTGLVIVLMLSGGQSLEIYAMHRAKRELTNLLQRTPTKTIKIVNGEYIDVSVDDIQKGDLILVKSGEIITVDGIVHEGESLVDEASITGEAMPILKGIGTSVISGTENTTGSLVIQATSIAAESRYASILALVREAAESKSPIVRMADKYAVFFTIVTFVMAGLAWILTKNTSNVLAVLVVATPCPLILATPIAMISGMSRMAKNGIIVKNGAAIESLALSRNMFFDKTGTITIGTPEVVEFKTLNNNFDIVTLAASLQSGSSHILAKAITNYAKEKNISILTTKNFREHFGEGVTGNIDNQDFVLGKLEFITNNNISITEEIRNQHHQYQENLV